MASRQGGGGCGGGGGAVMHSIATKVLPGRRPMLKVRRRLRGLTNGNVVSSVNNDNKIITNRSSSSSDCGQSSNAISTNSNKSTATAIKEAVAAVASNASDAAIGTDASDGTNTSLVDHNKLVHARCAAVANAMYDLWLARFFASLRITLDYAIVPSSLRIFDEADYMREYAAFPAAVEPVAQEIVALECRTRSLSRPPNTLPASYLESLRQCAAQILLTMTRSIPYILNAVLTTPDLLAAIEHIKRTYPDDEFVPADHSLFQFKPLNDDSHDEDDDDEHDDHDCDNATEQSDERTSRTDWRAKQYYLDLHMFTKKNPFRVDDRLTAINVTCDAAERCDAAKLSFDQLKRHLFMFHRAKPNDGIGKYIPVDYVYLEITRDTIDAALREQQSTTGERGFNATDNCPPDQPFSMIRDQLFRLIAMNSLPTLSPGDRHRFVDQSSSNVDNSSEEDSEEDRECEPIFCSERDCDAIFAGSKYHLNAHLMSHGILPHLCHVCNDEFDEHLYGTSLYSHHVDKHRRFDRSVGYRCSHCVEQFGKHSHLVEHIYQCHMSNTFAAEPSAADHAKVEQQQQQQQQQHQEMLRKATKKMLRRKQSLPSPQSPPTQSNHSKQSSPQQQQQPQPQPQPQHQLQPEQGQQQQQQFDLDWLAVLMNNLTFNLNQQQIQEQFALKFASTATTAAAADPVSSDSLLSVNSPPQPTKWISPQHQMSEKFLEMYVPYLQSNRNGVVSAFRKDTEECL